MNLSKPEHLDAFRAFRLTYLAFVDTLEEREEREFLAFFNYEGWLDSHVNKTPFQKVFPNF